MSERSVTPLIEREPPAPKTAVRNLLLQRKCACGATAGGGECSSCAAKREQSLQRRASGTPAAAIPASVDQVLASPGRPLDSATRQFMESRFQADFAGVRIHDDAAAAQSARDVQAQAYTVGQNIAFDSGQYRPDSPGGRFLLAHELAHTLQQQGLQRSGSAPISDYGSDYQRLEMDADRAATAVLSGQPVPSVAHAGGVRLSRATGSASAPAAPAAASRSLTVTTAYMTTTHLVTAEASAAAGGRTEASFVVDKLYVPYSKGRDGLARYQSTAGGALQAVLAMTGGRVQESAAWQERDDTAEMRGTWLQARGLTPGAAANAAWQASGGNAAFPECSTGTCQMDHIVELQLSGSNNAENLQPLDGPQNRDSGGALKYQAWGLCSQIAAHAPFNAASAAQIRLRFAAVQAMGTSSFGAYEAAQVQPVAGSAPPLKRGSSCLTIAKAMSENRAAGTATGAAGASAAPATTVAYNLVAGGANTSIQVPANLAADGEVNIFDDTTNRAAGTLISGLLLKKLKKGRPGTQDQVHATLDTTSEAGEGRSTRLPLSLTGAGATPIRFSVGPQPSGAMRMAAGASGIQFTYPYLSPGRITSLTVNAQGQVNWRGTITSSIPFLPRPLNVSYQDGSFRITSALSRAQLRSPMPGFRLTDARLELILAPTLSAEGMLAFAMGTGATPVATGSVTVGADATGLTAQGTLAVNIPGIDSSTATLTWRNGTWSGQVVIETSQIRLPYVQSGRLQIDLDAEGIRPSGEVNLLLPRNLGTATLGFRRESGRFVFVGGGRIRVPGLREVDVRGTYDGQTLTATASDVGFTWRGLDGRVNVTYTARRGGEGAITGDGTLNIRRGNVQGTITVRLNNSGRFSGRGQITYPFSIRGQRIEATAGITVDEEQNVRVDGVLRFPQPIELFRRFGADRQLFYIQRNIPIPGASIGPLGVVAVIEGGVSARYGFGPGQLRNVQITAAFNPLAENPDPNVAFHCELHIPANAGISGTIGGGIGLDAGVGSVTGTITITASLDLNATLGGPLDLRYQNNRFDLTARPGINAALDLGLSLDAHARARALGFSAEKSWNLGRRGVTLGRFSMVAPIAWSSDGGFNPPSMEQIEWGEPPRIDPPQLIRQLFSSASAEERPAA
ncbi:eCIS core domain-containing protein [Aquipseudomonas ullengensis]|uniref:DUF4157 domain-containing protein n=1 Tax=Aquipseudomonas ullengensis TaxID=2759166 RepID=A0A7W4LP64_9GAMM|nr:DUF4157 domain-containing protein [Pseudomonas ullengensis]MBB2496657.1 DUF4157 domain-containing protein [Pseudomonas ullengensis]